MASLLTTRATLLFLATLCAIAGLNKYEVASRVSDENLGYFYAGSLALLGLAGATGALTLYRFIRWAVTGHVSESLSLRRCFRRDPPARFCSKCGYDLRATPDRCPECGIVPDDTRRGAD